MRVLFENKQSPQHKSAGTRRGRLYLEGNTQRPEKHQRISIPDIDVEVVGSEVLEKSAVLAAFHVRGVDVVLHLQAGFA